MPRRGRSSSGKPAGPELVTGTPRPTGRAGQDLDRALRQAADALNLTLPVEFASAVGTYLDELARWARVAGLTGYRDRPAQVRHLILESLMLLTVLPAAAPPLLDIGSGPGVPGLILKLARPDWEVVLIEAARRRANFLRHVIRRLGLAAVIVHWGRAEEVAEESLAGRFQTVTMRAVASGLQAQGLARAFLAPTGTLVLPVGPRTPPGDGTRREVVLALPGELPWRRQFLIIPRTELDADVSRGTERASGPLHRGREPEGRRREDHERR
jgi:16S rRNA (guanine527-N7)-methyltransferase